MPTVKAGPLMTIVAAIMARPGVAEPAATEPTPMTASAVRSLREPVLVSSNVRTRLDASSDCSLMLAVRGYAADR